MEQLEDLILKQIQENKLKNLDYELIISQLTVLNNKPYEQIKIVLDKLVSQNRLQLKAVKKQFKKEKKIHGLEFDLWCPVCNFYLRGDPWVL